MQRTKKDNPIRNQQLTKYASLRCLQAEIEAGACWSCSSCCYGSGSRKRAAII